MSAQPADAPVQCVRRSLTTWTRCTCPPCKIDQLRLDKLRRVGRLPTARQVGAIRAAGQVKLKALLDDGWSPTAIADAYGIPTHVLVHIGAQWAAGHTPRPGQVLARRLLAGPVREPSVGLVPSWPLTRRVRALAAIGYPPVVIAERAGVARSVISDTQAGRRRQVSALTAAKIGAAYRALENTPGPSEAVAQRAEAARWGLPASWDDIDDPRERPKGLVHRRGLS